MECFGTPDTKNNLNKTTRKVQIPKAHTKTANRPDGIPSRARPRGATRIGRNRYQKPNKSKILSFLLFYFAKVSPARVVTSSFLRKRRWRHPGCCVSKLCITPPPEEHGKEFASSPSPHCLLALSRRGGANKVAGFRSRELEERPPRSLLRALHPLVRKQGGISLSLLVIVWAV